MSIVLLSQTLDVSSYDYRPLKSVIDPRTVILKVICPHVYSLPQI